jgi:hypothetical protein
MEAWTTSRKAKNSLIVRERERERPILLRDRYNERELTGKEKN